MYIGANSTLQFGYLNSILFIKSIGGNALQIQMKNTESKTHINEKIVNPQKKRY